jgi:hypothetical protein
MVLSKQQWKEIRMKFLKETTQWDSPTPNHTYIVSPEKWLAGYIKERTKEIIWFDKPLKGWSQTRRTFVDVTKNYKGLSKDKKTP